jgi:hypothetical protein
MKIINLIASIMFAIICIFAITISIIQKRIDLSCLGFIFGIISYIAYKDFCDPYQL